MDDGVNADGCPGPGGPRADRANSGRDPAAEAKNDLARSAEKRTKLEAESEEHTKEPAHIHPRMAEIYREQVMNLREALNDEAHRTGTADLIRRLIERIELTPDEDGSKEPIVDLRGDLAGILSVAAKTDEPLSESESSVAQVEVVAGACSQRELSWPTIRV